MSSSVTEVNKYKMLCIDMDGTLLNSEHLISELNVKTLQMLSSKGIIVAIATGRSAPSVFDYLDVLDLPQKETYIVCYNGTWCLQITKGEKIPRTLFSIPINNEDVRMLVSLSDRLGLVLQYYNGVSGEVLSKPTNSDHVTLLDRYAKLVGKTQTTIDDWEQAYATSPDGSAKVLILTNDPDFLIEESLKSLPGDKFHLIKGSPWEFFVEYLPKGSSKGEGVRRLCNSINVPITQVVAFGDGENDKEMLEIVGHGCAVANAKFLAKSVAKVVLEHSNDEDAVAIELLRLHQEDLL